MSPPTLTIDGRKFRVVPEEQYREMVKALKEQEARQSENVADIKAARKRLMDKRDRVIPYAEARKQLGLA